MVGQRGPAFFTMINGRDQYDLVDSGRGVPGSGIFSDSDPGCWSKEMPEEKGTRSGGICSLSPYRQENGPYQNNSGVSPNHKEWRTPNTGVNSTFSVTGQPYASLSQVTNEETPIQGVDIFGSRFGPGYITPARGWWNQVSDLNAATGLQVTRPDVLGANSQPNSSIWVDPSTLRTAPTTDQCGRQPACGETTTHRAQRKLCGPEPRQRRLCP